MDIQSGNFVQGNVVEDSFMGGKCSTRPHNYPKLENHQRLNLVPPPHKRINKIYDRTLFKNHGVFGDGSDWTTYPIMKLGPHGWMIDLDGVVMYLNCGNDPSLNITDVITIEAWVKPINSGENGYGRIISKHCGHWAFSLYMWGVDNERVRFIVGDAMLVYNATSAANTVPYSQWSHVVGVFNGSNVLIYTNGAEFVGEALVGPIYSCPTTDTILGNNNDGDRCFNGTIYEVRIYNRALSAAKTKDNNWRYNS